MTREQAVKALTAWHLAQVGYLEKADGTLKYLSDKTANAGYNNYTIYGYKMHQIQPRNMDYPAAWCDAYHDCGHVEVFGEEMARKLLHDFDDYTVNSVELYKKNGEWHTSNPQEGDQIFFYNSAMTEVCHTGYVYTSDSSRVYTVEGNTSSSSGVEANGGCVAKKSYPLNYARIAGYGRPNYDLLANVPLKGDELTVTQYEELKNMISTLTKTVGTISDDIDSIKETIGGTMVYNYIDKNMPSWAHEAVQWCMDKGIVQGTDDNGSLGLNGDKLWQCVVVYRLAQLIGKQINCKL